MGLACGPNVQCSASAVDPRCRAWRARRLRAMESIKDTKRKQVSRIGPSQLQLPFTPTHVRRTWHSNSNTSLRSSGRSENDEGQLQVNNLDTHAVLVAAMQQESWKKHNSNGNVSSQRPMSAGYVSTLLRGEALDEIVRVGSPGSHYSKATTMTQDYARTWQGHRGKYAQFGETGSLPLPATWKIIPAKNANR